MEFLDNLKQEVWKRGDANKAEAEGFEHFRIFKFLPSEVAGKGNYTYALFDDEGNLYKVNLIGADEHTDPLAGMGNVHLKIKNKTEIIGILAEDDCVLRKT